MPYLIDGHNLIGRMPDIHLDEPDDEERLLSRLNDFFNRKRISGTVYFDRGRPGMQRKFNTGRIRVEFSTSPNTADMAIMLRLRRLKKEASNYIIVSSDHQIINAARSAGARVMDSAEFARQLDESSPIPDEIEKPQGPMSQDDLRHWQNLFEKNGNDP